MSSERPRPALVVRALGGPCLVQDAGRPGLATMGVGRGGAADRASYALANRLLGNRPGVAALEMVLGGLEVEATSPCWVVVTGAPAELTVTTTVTATGTATGTTTGATGVRSRAEPTGAVLALRAGDRLGVGVPPTGLRSYLAVRGGLRVPPVLGSAAGDTLAGIGPAPLAVGDRIEVGDGTEGDIEVDAVAPASFGGTPVLRVVAGPRADRVVDPELLVATEWRAASESDRVGLRLEGARLEHRAAAGELPSEGALRGAVQVPPDGQPVVFGPDHPTTGGYPVVGVVVDADVDRLAQLRPGDPVRFRWA